MPQRYVNCELGKRVSIFRQLHLTSSFSAAKTIDLDSNGNAANVGKSGLCSQTAAKVVELQELLPRARVVYCSATSVSEPKNLRFMSRLGLWGPGEQMIASCRSRVEQILASIIFLTSAFLTVVLRLIRHSRDGTPLGIQTVSRGS